MYVIILCKGFYVWFVTMFFEGFLETYGGKIEFGY